MYKDHKHSLEDQPASFVSKTVGTTKTGAQATKAQEQPWMLFKRRWGLGGPEGGRGVVLNLSQGVGLSLREDTEDRERERECVFIERV